VRAVINALIATKNSMYRFARVVTGAPIVTPLSIARPANGAGLVVSVN